MSTQALGTGSTRTAAEAVARPEKEGMPRPPTGTRAVTASSHPRRQSPTVSRRHLGPPVAEQAGARRGPPATPGSGRSAGPHRPCRCRRVHPPSAAATRNAGTLSSPCSLPHRTGGSICPHHPRRPCQFSLCPARRRGCVWAGFPGGCVRRCGGFTCALSRAALSLWSRCVRQSDQMTSQAPRAGRNRRTCPARRPSPP